MNNTKDSTYHNHGLIIWSRVELNVAIVCACLPTLRVPLARWFPKMWQRSVKTFRLWRHDASEPATERWSDEAGDDISSLSKFKRAIRASFAGGEESQEKTNMAVSGHRMCPKASTIPGTSAGSVESARNSCLRHVPTQDRAPTVHASNISAAA